jgi:hypothetical protein
LNKKLISAGILNLITALIHTILGHYTLILPFVGIEFETPLKAILHSCWHMVTFTLFFSSLVFLYIGIKPKKINTKQVSYILGIPYIAFALIFIVLSFAYNIFLFQWVLLLPIGLLSIYGGKTV